MTVHHTDVTAPQREPATPADPDSLRVRRGDTVPLTEFLPPRHLPVDCVPSPDGTAVAWVETTAGSSHRLYCRAMGAADRPDPVATFDEPVVAGLAWSLDGSTVAVCVDRADLPPASLIYLVPVGGGTRRCLTPAGTRQVRMARQPFDPRGHLVYTANDRDRDVMDIIVHDLATDVRDRIAATDCDFLAEARSVSPDGRWLLALAVRSPTDITCLLVELETGTTREVTPRGARAVPGPWLADSSGWWLGLTEATDTGQRGSLARYDLATDTVTAVETASCAITQCAAAADTVAWVESAPAGDTVHVRHAGTLILLPPLPLGVVRGLGMSGDGRWLTMTAASAQQPAESVAVDLHTGTVDQLTDCRAPAHTGHRALHPVSVRYPSDDGDVPAWLYRPANAGGPVPVVLWIEGTGHRPTYGSGVIAWLVASGIAVLAPTLGEGCGAGRACTDGPRPDWGGGDLRDLLAALRYLRGQDWVSVTKIAVVGWSCYAGFLALSCLTRHPEAGWAAGAAVNPVTDLLALALSTPTLWRDMVSAEIGDLVTDTREMLFRSPVTHADRLAAPLLLLQRAGDRVVHPAQTSRFVDAARSGAGDWVQVWRDVDVGGPVTELGVSPRGLADLGEFLAEHLLD